jgi:hypothetical protein
MSLRRLLFTLSLAALTIPAAAGATHSPSLNPPRDFAAGGGSFVAPNVATFRFSVGATSGPLGEDPHGHVRVSLHDASEEFAELFTVNGRVECLLTTGRKAVIGALAERGEQSERHVALSVLDGDHADLATVVSVSAPPNLPPQAACAAASFFTPIFPIEGNVVVHDGLPTTTAAAALADPWSPASVSDVEVTSVGG